MSNDKQKSARDGSEASRGTQQATEPPPQKTLTPEAQRALAEAAERRRLRDEELAEAQKEKEVGGREGADPVRYGDWEKGGIAWDF